MRDVKVLALVAALASSAPPVFAGELAPPGEDDAAEFAFVELEPSRPAYYLGQPVHVTVRFGVDSRFLAERAVQPFRQRLDVPVQLRLPWVEDWPGAELLDLPPESSLATFALNGDVHPAARRADRVEGERAFEVYEVRVRLEPTAARELRFPPPELAVASASRFEENLLDQRVPVDRVDSSTFGSPVTVSVRSLPEAGRPPEFTGAVGNLSIEALAPPGAAPGEPLKLQVVVRGEGNLSAFATPAWSELGGYRVLGILDEAHSDERRWTLDLEPYSDRVWQVPPVELAYFDPGPPAAYRTLRTAAVDLGAPEEDEPVSRPTEELGAAARAPGSAPRSHSSRIPLWAGLVGGAALLAMGLVLVLRRT